MDDSMLWNHRPPPPAKPKPGEPLFEFIRTSDGTPMTCELRFHGESYSREAQFLLRGELFYARGGFALRDLAVQWAEQEHDATMRR